MQPESHGIDCEHLLCHFSHCTQVRDIVSKKAEMEVIASDACIHTEKSVVCSRAESLAIVLVF